MRMPLAAGVVAGGDVLPRHRQPFLDPRHQGRLRRLGDWSDETQETWWTLYPYLGLEIKRPLRDGLVLYSSMRVGATVVTYNYSNAYNLPVYPRMGVVAGWRSACGDSRCRSRARAR